MKVHFLNVGHGDMSLVEVAGKNILVDCNIKDENDAIEDINKVFTNKVIDYLILTHLHEDHISGIQTLENSGYSFKTIYESGYRITNDKEAENAEPYKSTVEFLNNNNAIKLVASDSKVNSDSDFDMYCLNSNNSGDNIHYNSLVIKIVENGKSILFAGDSNCEAWQDMITDNYEELLKSDILHASHHGSRTFFFTDGQDYENEDAYDEHIEAIAPTYVIISAPSVKDKREDCPPHEEAIKLYEKFTSSDGSVEITGEKDKIVFECNSESCNVSERSYLSELHKSIKGQYRPAILGNAKRSA